MRVFVTALLGGMLLAACIRPGAFPCVDDSQCDVEPQGACVLPEGYCAYPDDDCGSGLRFESRAPGGLAESCVDDDSAGTSTGSVEPSDDSTDESTGESSDGSTGEACGDANALCCPELECSDASLLCFGQRCGCVIDLVAGDTHTCAIRLDNHLECWGGNVNQELGRNDPGQLSTEPAPVVGLPQPLIVQSAQARSHTCVVALGGDVYCWGANTYGQSAPGVPEPLIGEATEVELDGLGWEPEAVGVGPNHTCLAGETNVFCWGDNEFGQLGWPADEPEPVDTSTITENIVEVSAGFGHTCVRTGGQEDRPATERVYCWGYDGFGQLGAGLGDDSSIVPQEVAFAPGTGVATLVGSDWHNCALTYRADDPNLRTVECWGYDETGAASGVSGPSVESPAPVPGLAQGAWESLSLGPQHGCVSGDELGTWCWGFNETGAVNPTAGPEILPPTEVPAFDARGVFLYSSATGTFHTCGIASDASITCWGCGGLGQLGEEWLFCDENEGGCSVRSTCE